MTMLTRSHTVTTVCDKQGHRVDCTSGRRGLLLIIDWIFCFSWLCDAQLDSASVAMTSAVMDDDGDADYDEGEKSEATIQSSETIKVEQYTPHINGEGDWLLSDIDLGASIQWLDQS